MYREEELAAWQERYAAWLSQARPLLETGNFKDGFALGYPYPRPTEAPWTPVKGPLAALRLGVVSTGGFYLRGQQVPFDAENVEGDPGYRTLPLNVTAADLAIAHTHYPHAAALADWNAILPVDHLRALVAEGTLGGLGGIWSTSGFATDSAAICRHAGPGIAREARAAGCDALLVIPV